eukprot:3743461-Pyramimonas_sp.AAC.1
MVCLCAKCTQHHCNSMLTIDSSYSCKHPDPRFLTGSVVWRCPCCTQVLALEQLTNNCIKVSVEMGEMTAAQVLDGRGSHFLIAVNDPVR